MKNKRTSYALSYDPRSTSGEYRLCDEKRYDAAYTCITLQHFTVRQPKRTIGYFSM